MSAWFRMSDDPTASKAAIPIARAEARQWNTPELGFGIFKTVNSFNGPRRKENLRRIDAWAIDMDEGTKAQQAKRLHSSPLVPSIVIETKRGYQAYWAAANGNAAHWNAIVLERLVPFFGADKNARDLCRILRVPGYLHLKDPSNPFRIRIAAQQEVAYTESQMGAAFKWVPNKQLHDAGLAEQRRAVARTAAVTSGVSSESLWDAVYALDAKESLLRLSGTNWVGGEVYTFRTMSNGNANLFVDGKGTSCFVDSSGHIGSLKGFGPTAAQWLRFWNHSWPEVIRALKDIHPHLVDIDDAQRKSRAA